jgi:FkbM family methyltransferase
LTSDPDRWLAEDADKCIAAIGVGPGQKVLDFGCGRGRYSIPAARVVGKRGKVYAIDKNTETLETLRHLASSQELPSIDTINIHGGVHIPLENESVDVAFLHDVLHLIGWEESAGRTIRRSTSKDRRLLLKEVRRVMKWDGLLSVFSPHLVTHTDITSEDDLKREIASVGFRLEKEMYRQVIHDDCLQQGHLYSFCRRRASEPAQASFVYDSSAFQTELKQDAHHHGEVTMLKAMAEPGMIAFELGANRGVTTVALAKSVGSEGQVHAFEPVPEFYAALMENLRLNDVDNVRVHQLAATDKESTVTYYKHGEGSGIVQSEDAEDIVVGTTSLDSFMMAEDLRRVDLINMDCEGAELLVLQGARDTLQRNTPCIFCEIHHDYLSRLDQSVDDIVEYLHMLGFQVKPVSVESLDEDVEFGSCTHILAATNGNLPDTESLGRRQEKEYC